MSCGRCKTELQEARAEAAAMREACAREVQRAECADDYCGHGTCDALCTAADLVRALDPGPVARELLDEVQTLRDVQASFQRSLAAAERSNAELQERLKAEEYASRTLTTEVYRRGNEMARLREALTEAKRFVDNVQQYGALRSEVDVPKLLLVQRVIDAALAASNTQDGET